VTFRRKRWHSIGNGEHQQFSSLATLHPEPVADDQQENNFRVRYRQTNEF